ncbi:MAG: SDR family NAD(P)-dependent oxidoreductase [Verrucomicrobiae bacterium]
MVKNVIITGGAQGIGFGIAKCFARQGAGIIIADVKEEEAAAAAAKLVDEGARTAHSIRCDITHYDDVRDMVATAVEKLGRIDVLVNNAGISPFIDVMDLTPETFHKVLDVNLTGAFYCTQLVGRHMIEQVERGEPSGRILFISSLAPKFSQPSQAEYSASKAGVEGLMRGFATRLGGHGITCNAIAPGMILTPLTENYWSQPGPAEQIKQLVPLKRIGTPEDIGNVALLLVSDQAAYINGAVIPVDGGFSVLIKG